MLTVGRFFCGHFFIEYRSQRRCQKSSISSLTKKRFGFNPEGIKRHKDQLAFFETVRKCIEGINNCHNGSAGAVHIDRLARWYHPKGKWIFNNGGDVEEAKELLTKALELITIVNKRMNSQWNPLYEENMNESEKISEEIQLLNSFIEKREEYPGRFQL